MLSLILLAAFAGSPGGQTGSWILTKKLDKSVGYVWGYKDAKGFVHSLTLEKAKPGDQTINYGVERKKFEAIPDGIEWYGGNAPASFHKFGSTGTQPKRTHLTVIGPKEKRDAVMADLARDAGFQALATELGDSLAVQNYDPADPMIMGLKLADGGNPDVIVQSESGKVRYRAHDYAGAATVAAEIRRADPRYDPKKDPNGKPALMNLEDYFKDLPQVDNQTAIIIVLIIFTVAYVSRK